MRVPKRSPVFLRCVFGAILRLSVAVVLLLGTGCASLLSKSTYPVTVRSEPPGASVTVKDSRGSVIHRGTTPFSVILKASDGFFQPAHYRFDFVKEGYEPTSVPMTATLDLWYLGNILFGGLIGLLIVDPLTGAMFKLGDSVYAVLPPAKSYIPPSRPTPSPSAIPSPTVRYAPSDFAEHPHRGRTAAVLMFDARGGLSADEVAILTDRFAVEIGRMDVYRLVSQSKMKEVLEFQKFSTACTSVECAVEAGQHLGVEYIIYGSIGKIGTVYTINVYLTSVEKGTILASATVDHRGTIEDVLTEGVALAAGHLLLKAKEGGR